MPSASWVEHDLSPVIRLLVAAVLAGIVGWERERAGKQAGLRTHIIVGLAAALYVSLVDIGAERYAHYGSEVRFDFTRAIDAIATGIGFLGGGIIFVSQGADRIHGATTAASIWATAAVGAAVGMEAYGLATGATLLLVAVLHFLLPLDHSRQPSDHTRQP
ncbi:MAG TPA: MgtC/SapB family protein [Gemmatimonadales bacterium]|nr:MgtC/SapB family protein [Gemmatimonadales bacterium]